MIRGERLRGTVRRSGGIKEDDCHARFVNWGWSFPGGADCGADANSPPLFFQCLSSSHLFSSSADSYCVSNWQVWIGKSLAYSPWDGVRKAEGLWIFFPGKEFEVGKEGRQ